MAKPSKQNLNARLEQAKQKLKINQPNPFDVKKSHTHQQVLNKNLPNSNINRPKPVQNSFKNQPKPQESLKFVQDDQQKTATEIQTQIADFVLQKQEAANHFKISPTDKIYKEIQQKSKNFREEKKQTKMQLDKKIYQIDQIQQQLKQILPQREIQVIQRHNDEVQDLVAANKGQLTHDDAVRAGAARLVELQRNIKTQRIVYDLGDDDVDMNQFRAESDDNSDRIEESEGIQEEIDLKLDDYDGEEGTSAFIQSLPFIIRIPEKFAQFNFLLNKARNSEEIVVLDRLIKSNSTLNDKANASQMEKLASFTFKRFLEINDFTRKDCCMRCFRHISYELPSHCAGVLFNHLNGYKTLQIFEISLIFRLINICYIQTDFSTEQVNNLFQLAFLVSETILFSNINSLNQALQHLFLTSQIATLSINCYRYSSTVINSLSKIVKFIDFNPKKFTPTNQKLDLRVLFSQFYTQEISQNLIGQIIANITNCYQIAFKIPQNFLSENLQFFTKNIQFQQEPLNYIKEKPAIIQQLEPLYAQNYDPRKDLDLDRTKARTRALEKAEKRVQRDSARKNLKEKRQEVVMRQTRMKERLERVGRIRGLVSNQYDHQTHEIKGLNKLEKKAKGRK